MQQNSSKESHDESVTSAATKDQRAKQIGAERKQPSASWEIARKAQLKGPVWNIWRLREEIAASGGYILDCSAHPLIPPPPSPEFARELRWPAHLDTLPSSCLSCSQMPHWELITFVLSNQQTVHSQNCLPLPPCSPALFKEICPGGMGYTVLPNPPANKPPTTSQEPVDLLPPSILPTAARPVEAFGKDSSIV